MRFIPLGQEEQEKPAELKFIPLSEEPPATGGELVFKPLDQPVPGRVYQDVGEVDLTSPEQLLTPPPATEGVAVKPGGFQPELVKEQLKSGVTGLQEGHYATAAKNNAELLNMMDRIDRGEKVRPIDDVLGYADMDPVTRKQTRDSIQSTLTGTVAKTIAYGEERKGYKRNENADLMISLADKGDLSKAWQVFSQDPVGIIQQLSVESTPNALPSLVAGGAGLLLRGGIGGLMAGLAGGSFPVEYMASITDSLRDAGVDLKDAAAVEAKLRDPKFLEEAGKRAVTRGTVIAAADAASGKLLMPFKAGQLGKNAARAVGNIGTETSLEMAGEAAAQAAADEEFKLGQILAEGLGAGPQAAVGTALKSIPETRAIAEKAAAPAAPEQPAVTEPTAPAEEPAVAPPVEPPTEAGALYKDTVTRFQRQGFSPSDAARFAEEELKEAGYGPDDIDTGRREFSVSVSSGEIPGDAVASTPAEAESQRLEQVSQPAAGAGERTTSVLSALEPFKQELTQAYGDDTTNKILARAAEMTIEEGGLTPQTAIRAATAEVVEDVDTASTIDTTQTEAAKAEDTRTTPDVAATGMQPKGKKTSPGRPKIVLTPEQKAQKQEQRKLTQKASIDATRSVDKAAKTIAEPFDPDAFPDEQLLKEAQETRDAEVIEALTTAFKVANDPRFRKNKPGEKARTLIDQFPPTSRVRQIAEARAKLGAPSQSLTTTTNEHDPDMMKFGDAQQLLGYVKAMGTAFEKVLADRIRPFLKGVRVVHVADPDRDIIDDEARGSFTDALGMYFKKAIYLNANPESSGQNNETALHEALHGATVAKIERFYTNPDSMSNSERMAVRQLLSVRDRAYAYYEELLKRAMDDPQFAKDNARMLAKLDSLADSDGINVFGDVKEFVSYGLTQPEFQEFLMQAPGVYDPQNKKVVSLFTKFVQALRQLLNMGPEHMSALQDLIIVTDQIIGAAQPVGTPALARKAKAAKKQEAKVDKDMVKIKASDDAHDVVKALGNTIPPRSFKYYKALFDARFESMGNGFIRKWLYNMQTVDILRWKGDEIPGLVEVDKIQQEMGSMKTQLLNASAEKADRLAAFIRKNGMQVISGTMHLARLKKVNPTAFATLAEAQLKDPVVVHYEKILSDPTYRQKYGIDINMTPQQTGQYKKKLENRRDDLKMVYDYWTALGKQKDGHEVYKMVRQFYKDNYLAYRTILDDHINALPISADAKAKLLKSVRLMQEQAKGAPDPDYDGMTLKQMPEEYFPFKRHGDYWLRVTKGPAGREFYTFDTAEERNLFLEVRAKQLGKDPADGAEFAAEDDISSLRADFSTDSLMLQQMFAAIDEAKADGRFDPSKYKTEADAKEAFDRYREELKDQLYQTYLMTMPERSFRKQFLHAENVTGFSADVLRNFKTSATAYANQLAKLKYGDQLRNEVQRARDSLEGMPPLERARLNLFVNEISIRADEEIDPPPPNQVANRVNQFAFVWLLTGGATAATQMASIPTMVVPTLKQRYGVVGTTREFLRYATFFKTVGVTKTQPNGDVEFTAPSIGSSAMVRNDPVLARAFQAAVDRHITTLTNTSVLTNRNRTPDNAYDHLPGVAARTTFNVMTALFNGAERMSREIAYMMTFKLEYEKTKDFNKSVDVAADAVHELLGRYDDFNRPRILRNSIGKTVGQFKMYAVFVTSWFIRNGYTALTEGMGNKEGRAALERLIGVVIMGGLFHGIVGQPLYSTICSTIDAILDGLDDDEEKAARRAKNPLTSESSNLRFRYEFLPKYFGDIMVPGIDGREYRLSELLEKGPISVLTDMNIGSRTSFDGIWFREAKPGKNWVESVENFIFQNLGPGVSTGINMVGAIDDFIDGKIQRGLEKLVPAFFKGSLVAYRLDTEGAETKGGDKLLQRSELSDLNLIAAVTGFQSARLARIQEHNFAMNKEVMAAENSRTKALRSFNEAMFNAERDPKDIPNALNKIIKHNNRYPMESFFITDKTLERSLESYAETKGLTFRGLRVPEKMIPYLIPSATKAAPVPPKD